MIPATYENPRQMSRRAAPHRGIDLHYGDEPDTAASSDAEAAVYVDPSRPSKTQRKQQSHALQDLGEALTALSDERLDAIDMPESLRDAIAVFRKTRSHEGRRRQMQYVGKLMRGADEAVLREAVAAATLGSAQHALALHEAEQWRLALISDDEAMTRWLQAHPETDTQQLRSLVRAARRDAAGLPPEARQPKSFRELFQFLRPLLATP
jgi:ribosome-associated protein